MSDHDATPGPIDKAYVQAEAMLTDETARAARRARVLAAVASEPAGPAAEPAPPRRGAQAIGGWLAAAGVAGVTAFVAFQLNPPRQITPPPGPTAPAATTPAVPTTAAPATTAPPVAASPKAVATAPPAGPAPTAAPAQAAAEPEAVVTAERRMPSDAAPVAQAPLAPPPPPPAPFGRAAAPPPPAAQASRPSASTSGVEELVVTSQRVERRRSAKAAADRARATPEQEAQSLREAAEAGRLSEIRALLSGGAEIDAADEDGETALMKAVRANQPAAAALLRQRGASLRVKNRAGESVKDIAAEIDDAKLNRALRLDR